VQPERGTRYVREDVRAFVVIAKHALTTGELDSVSASSVETRVGMMLAEVDRLEPRWELLRTWGVGVRDLLRTVSTPAVVIGLDALRWP
jgi:hypothetical protein